jgi:hypothetical protein
LRKQRVFGGRGYSSQQLNNKNNKIMRAKMKSARTFGVEIEFISNGPHNREDVAAELRHYGIDAMVENYGHQTRGHWKVITDSSCGYEIVSPVLSGKEGLKDTQTVLDVMTRMEGVTVNRECGIHVHVHLEGFNPNNCGNLLKTYAKYEKEIDTVFPESRRGSTGNNRGNQYANGLINCFSRNYGLDGEYQNKKTQFYDKITKIQSDWKSGNLCDSDAMHGMYRLFSTRYTTCNLECYSRYGTVEFRQHSGSLSSEKVCTWIVFCTNLVDRCAKVKFVQLVKDTSVMKNFANIFGENQSRPVLKYMEQRALNFGFDQVSGAYAHATAMRRV